jgi:hypothetical protein
MDKSFKNEQEPEKPKSQPPSASAATSSNQSDKNQLRPSSKTN